MSENVQYRVTAPMVQVFSRAPNLSDQRHYRRGDVLPAWVDPDEVDRWTAMGLVEEAS